MANRYTTTFTKETMSNIYAMIAAEPDKRRKRVLEQLGDNPDPELGKMKVADLRALAKELRIERYNDKPRYKLFKEELIQAILNDLYKLHVPALSGKSFVKKSAKSSSPTLSPRVCKSLKQTERVALTYSAKSEETFEVFQTLKRNPESIAPKQVKFLKESGVTRKSVQISGGDYVYTHFDMKSYDELNTVKQLFLAGVTTVPVIPSKKIQEYQRKFDAALHNFREYKRDPENPELDSEGNPLVYVAGGFAALGNPSSFHNEFSREMRELGFEAMMELMKGYSPMIAPSEVSDVYRLQALSDRMMFRQKGQKPTAESWHRDVMKPGSIDEYDELFGGWINLDLQDQYFSCIPGSHLDIVQKRLEAGFATLSGALDKINGGKTDPKELKAAMTEVTQHRHQFTVPPGHMIVFPQYILHEVVANIAEYNMRRQFTGWRLTTMDGPLYPITLFDDNAVIPLPGSMKPPMYAQMHLMGFKNKPFKMGPETKYSLVEWSEASFHERCIGENGIVHRHMKSLTEYGFELYPKYTKKEKRILSGVKVIE